MIEVLSKQHQVLPVNLTRLEPKILRKKFDILIASPLSLILDKKVINVSKKMVLLSMGYDLNEELKEKDPRTVMLKNLQAADLVVIDNPVLIKALRSDLCYTGETYYLPYGCLLEDLARIKNPKGKVMGTNRGFSEHYGNQLIIEAISMLQEYDYEKFVMVEHGSFSNNFIEQNRELLANIKCKINPGGDTETTLSFLNEIKFFISASKSDGSSVSMLEAMASGKICIVTNHPCNTYWIKNGVEGFTFLNGSKHDLYLTLKRALKMTDKQVVKMTQLAKMRVYEEANWFVNAEKFTKVLEYL
jgi:glycosyltransferase involved in cell wall biosynthesis